MRKYELMFIVKTDIEESAVNSVVDSLKKVLKSHKAKILEEKALGQKELAYEIKKHKIGYYFLLTVEADSAAIDEFERVILINENVLRHIVVRVED